MKLFSFLRKMPTWLIVTSIIFGLAGLFVLKVRLVGPTYLSREQFKSMVIMKTPEEVIKAVGKPYHTTNYGNPEVEQIWWYEHRTYDPVTGKIDSSTRIYFQYGFADHVVF